MGISWLFERMAYLKDEPAIVWQDRAFSYGELLERVADLKAHIALNEGLCGQVVALKGDYSPGTAALLMTLIDQKNIIVPLTEAAREQHEEFMDTAEVQAVIHWDQHDQIQIERRGVVVTHPLTLSLIEQAAPGLVLFSSGSTGKNKAALHNFERLLEKFKPARRKMRTLTFLLFDHIGGINTLFYTLSNGGTVVSIQDRNPKTVCQAVEKHRVELLPTTPSFMNLLIISMDYLAHDLSSLKLITYGTEIMPESTLRRVRNIFPRVDLLQTYGLSELGILRSKSREDGSLWVKVGGEGFETKVVDGILWVRAHSAMLGYLNAPSPFDEQGWMNTQDMVEVDGDYLRILGRKSDIINVGGQKVYPAEVESVLMDMANVKEAAVRGEVNSLTGNIVVAKVFLENPEDPSSLKKRVRKFCKERLQSYKIPVRIEIGETLQYSERYKKVRN